MKIATLNAWMGGYRSYRDTTSETPVRLAAIKEILRQVDADVIVLTDTFRWAETMPTERLRKEFGYEYVASIDLGPNATVDPRIGITVLSRYRAEFTIITIKDRYCLRAIIFDPNQRPRIIYGVYADPFNEEIRRQEFTALLADGANFPDAEVWIIGDYNTTAPEEHQWIRRFSRLVSTIPGIRQHPSISAVTEALRSQVIPKLREAGYKDALEPFKPSPTIGLRIPLIGQIGSLRVDHFFVRKGKREVVKAGITWDPDNFDHALVYVEILPPRPQQRPDLGSLSGSPFLIIVIFQNNQPIG